jgi:predicted MFS family arabinose efflux permease
MTKPEIAGFEIAPLGISLVTYLIIIGLIFIKIFFDRQKYMLSKAKEPLLDVSMLKSKQLRSGLGVLMAQYIITASIFFVIPVYLQMTLGLDALQTGYKILPLSLVLIIFSILGTRLINRWSPKKIVRVGQILLIFSAVLLMGSLSTDLKSKLFAAGMFMLGGGLGLLASQVGNVNMSAVDNSKSSEVGGLQGVFQNLGSSLGTALIGSVMIMSLTSTFVSGVNTSNLPENIKAEVNKNSQVGVSIAPVNQVTAQAESKGASKGQAQQIENIYEDAQLSSLKISLAAVAVIATLTLLFSKNIPTDKITK